MSDDFALNTVDKEVIKEDDRNENKKSVKYDDFWEREIGPKSLDNDIIKQLKKEKALKEQTPKEKGLFKSFFNIFTNKDKVKTNNKNTNNEDEKNNLEKKRIDEKIDKVNKLKWAQRKIKDLENSFSKVKSFVGLNWTEIINKNKSTLVDTEVDNNDNKQKDNQELKKKGINLILDKAIKWWDFHISKNKQQYYDQKKIWRKAIDKKKKVDKIIVAERTYKEGLMSVKDLIAPSSMEVKYNFLNFSGMYAQSFFVITYPRFIESGWMNPIVNLDVEMDMSIYFYPIDSVNILKQLTRKVTELESTIMINQERGKTRDPLLENTLRDIENLRDRLQVGEEKFFQVGLYFSIYDQDFKKLQRTAKQLETLLGGKLLMLKRADLRMEEGLKTTLPQMTDKINVVRSMNSGPLSTFFPFLSSTLSQETGILYGINRHNDSLVIFDRFSMENANMNIFATSGAGKSYTAKLEMLRNLMFGSEIIVIDPENEYEDLCAAVGGSYIDISLNSPNKINPFDLPKPFEDEDVNTGDLLKQNIITLSWLLKIMLGDLTAEEDALIDQALINTYAIKGITLDTEDVYSVIPPTMEDLYDVLSTMKGGETLAIRLSKYVTGTLSGVFNEYTNVLMENTMIVFCVRDLDMELRPMSMYVILNFIWNKVRSKLKKRLLYIDEAWNLLQYKDSGRFLFWLVKRARKYYLWITTITQDVEDFLKSDFGKPIITNSSMQILLKQSPTAVDYLQTVFHLTNGEKMTLLNSGVGQGIFFAGRNHVAIQIISSPSEHNLITTNPQDILNKEKTEKEK